MAEFVPAVGEGAAVGLLALLDQAGFVVVPHGALAQGVGVAEQAAFGITLEMLFGVVWQGQAHQLPGAVMVGGDVARSVGKPAELAEGVVLPLADFARAVGVAGQLAVGVVGQVFAAAEGVGNEHRQVVAVVGVAGCVLQRIEGSMMLPRGS